MFQVKWGLWKVWGFEHREGQDEECGARVEGCGNPARLLSLPLGPTRKGGFPARGSGVPAQPSGLLLGLLALGFL